MPFLHTKEEWCLLFNSAITLLMDFVDMGFHISATHGKEIMNEYETKCRLYQCQHLHSIITFLEDQNHSTRLLGNFIPHPFFHSSFNLIFLFFFKSLSP